MRASFVCLFGFLIAMAPTMALAGSDPFELKSGDRIVLVGDTMIERDQRFGYLETLLTLLHPDKDLTFRNLGWSGDTVAGLSRAGFDPPEAGHRRLIEQVHAARPTVLIVGYGMADSFDGEPGRARFVSGLNRFLDEVADTHARVVLLSPIACDRPSPELPDPAPHNAMIERYAQSIAEIAQSRGARFIDLFGPTRDREAHAPITDDGVVPNETGSRFLAGVIVRGLDPSAGREVPHVEVKGPHFRITRPTLAVLGDGTARPLIDTSLVVKATGLSPGRHELRIEGRPIVSKTAEEWAAGVSVDDLPDRDRVERLRAAIHAKNRLFFHRWRPQNITYLFGFRKHEQGNNAVEIPRFDPLVEEQERAIARLRRPVGRECELVHVEGQAGS